MLHPLEVLGVRDLPRVHPVPVTGAPGLDLLDIAVGLRLRGSQVIDDDLRVPDLVDQLGAVRGQRGDLSDLGKVGALVPELVGLGVQRLDVEQLQLGERVGFQRVLLRCGSSRDR
ncbi:MAG: hypothetical protein Q7J48_08675 [Nocardioides sp.]|nr:hypothetical protein [Nocardioides sp.]